MEREVSALDGLLRTSGDLALLSELKAWGVGGWRGMVRPVEVREC